MSNPAPTLQDLLTLFQARRFTEMEAAARQLLARDPANGVVWKALGVALQIQGQDALPALSEAARLLPGDAEALTNLGALLSDRGQQDEAIARHGQALALQPQHAEAHNNLGLALSRAGRFEESRQSLEQALQLRPAFAEALLNLGNTLAGLGRDADAVERYRQALRLRPGWPLARQRSDEALLRVAFAHARAGLLMQEQQRFADAVACYEQATALQPHDALFAGDLANALRGAGRLAEGMAQHRRAIAMAPEQAHQHANLARALKSMGRIAEADESYSKVIELEPENFAARSDLLLLRSCFTEQPMVEQLRKFGALVTAAARPFDRWQRHGDPGLRVGIVSGDLRSHPVGYFSASVLAALAARGVQLTVYASVTDSDALSERIRAHCQAWRVISGMDDEAAAALIHADQLDVLIDLAGHTANNRLPLFAWRPAPVQASWLGWCASTGVAEIDAYLGDRWITPPELQSQFTETLVPLPDAFLCFTPPALKLDPSPLPALMNSHITFGCFNSLAKLNDRVLALWSRILQALPDARLLLKNGGMDADLSRSELLARFAGFGIGSERLQLEGASPRADYLAAHQRIDIALDPFPYPGGTTSMDALWMGVPVLTLPGHSALSRQGESILRNLSLPDWVARDEQDYVDRALAHAADTKALSDLRQSLRQRLLASPLCDATRFAANFEAALRSLMPQARA